MEDVKHYSSLKDWGGILLRVIIYLGGFLVALYGLGYIVRNTI
jgi:hypothetical protein